MSRLELALPQALPEPPRPELFARAFLLRPAGPLPGPGRLSGRCLRGCAGLPKAARRFLGTERPLPVLPR